MQTTTRPRETNDIGRLSSRVAAVLRREIIRNKLKSGQFLPTERELAKEHAVSRETARRALKILGLEGFITTVPRRGYRVLPRTDSRDEGLSIAYVLTAIHGHSWTGTHDSLLAAFYQAVARRGRSLLVVGTPASSPSEVLRQLQGRSVCGLALDTADPRMIELAAQAGIPAIVVNDWAAGSDIDSVMQDGQYGGLLAAEYLATRRRKRIAWLGRPVADSAHSFDRYSGTVAGLTQFGIELPPELRVFADWDESRRKALELLSRRDRPDGVVALWREDAWNLATAARELGLVLGEDLDVVGWSVEEGYESKYAPGFNGGPVAPPVTWNAAALAETVVSRLEERRLKPQLPALRIKIPVRLRVRGNGDEPSSNRTPRRSGEADR